MAVLSSAEARTARAQKHAGRSIDMPCGREVYGNGGQHSHQNHCRQCLTIEGAYMAEWVREGIFLNLRDLPLADRLAAYTDWKRQEGDRLLAAMDARR